MSLRIRLMKSLRKMNDSDVIQRDEFLMGFRSDELRDFAAKIQGKEMDLTKLTKIGRAAVKFNTYAPGRCWTIFAKSNNWKATEYLCRNGKFSFIVSIFKDEDSYRIGRKPNELPKLTFKSEEAALRWFNAAMHKNRLEIIKYKSF